MKKILFVNGSLNARGNSSYLLVKAMDAAKEAGAECELIHLIDYPLEPCTSWDPNEEVGDDLKPLLDKFIEYPRAIFSVPVHSGSVPHQFKNFMERMTDAMYKAKVTNKVVSFIICGGWRYGAQEVTLMQLIYGFLMQGSVVIGLLPDGESKSTFPIASLVRDDGTVGFVKADELAVSDAKKLGKRMAEFTL